MAVYIFGGHRPKLPPTGECFIAPTASVIGKVEIGRQVSVWFGAVLRGDYEFIRVGDGSNVQDNAVLHTDWGCPLTIGKGVVIGHSAILHGCTVGDDVLVGMGAKILNSAVIGEGSIIAAGTLVPERKEIPPRSLVMGVPGRVVREISDEQIEKIRKNARDYQEKIPRYLDGLEEA